MSSEARFMSLRGDRMAGLVAAVAVALTPASPSLAQIDEPPLEVELSWFALMLAQDCAATDPARTRDSMTVLLGALEMARGAHAVAALQLADAWRQDADLQLRRLAAQDSISSILAGVEADRNPSRMTAANNAVAAAEQALTRRLYRMSLRNVERNALARDEADSVPLQTLWGQLAGARTAAVMASRPGLSSEAEARLAQAYNDLSAVESERLAVQDRIHTLRGEVRETYLTWRVLEPWEPLIQSCLATLDGAPARNAGRDPAPPGPTVPLETPGTGPPTTRMSEFWYVTTDRAPAYAGEMGMTLNFQNDGLISGTVRGGATVRGRWGGTVAEGEITGLPSGRVGHFKFTEMRLERVANSWVLKSNGLWCAIDPEPEEEEDADSDTRARFWGHILAPGAAVSLTPPMEALRLCDSPWRR